MNLQTSENLQLQKVKATFGDFGPGSRIVGHTLGALFGFLPAAFGAVTSGSLKPLSSQWDELSGLIPGSQEFNDIVSPPSAMEVSQRNIQHYADDNPSLSVTKSYS
jgi:hypothetical protein